MRAIFLKEFSVTECPASTFVEGDAAHHLNRVIRIKVGEEILIMNGVGETFLANVKDISKKAVGVEVVDIRKHDRPFHIDFAVGLTKRDAFEDIVRSLTELGVNSIIPISSEFSQRYDIKQDRLDRIIESALIQSNNPFSPKITMTSDFENLKELSAEYDQVFYFSSIPQESKLSEVASSGKFLVVIGPEGGMSKTEEEMLLSLPNISLIHLKCPILRASTAVNVAMGFLFANFCG